MNFGKGRIRYRQMKEVFTVDRIEGDYFVIETPEEDIINVEKYLVESGAKEGDCLVKKDGHFRIDIEETKKRKEEIICCLAFNSIAATFLLLRSIYGINSAKCTLFLVSSYANEYNDYHVYGDHSYSRCVRRGRI